MKRCSSCWSYSMIDDKYRLDNITALRATTKFTAYAVRPYLVLKTSWIFTFDTCSFTAIPRKLKNSRGERSKIRAWCGIESFAYWSDCRVNVWLNIPLPNSTNVHTWNLSEYLNSLFQHDSPALLPNEVLVHLIRPPFSLVTQQSQTVMMRI